MKTWITGLLGLALLAPPTAEAAGYKVIVHPAVSGRRIARKTLADIFLRRVVQWGDRSPITPVDLSLTSPVRQEFLERVLEMTKDGLHTYWLREMSRDRFPPVTKETEDRIVAFVASRPGAIGYVGSETSVPDTVKVVEIE